MLGEERRDLRLPHDGGVHGGEGGVRVEKGGRDAVEDSLLDEVQAVSDHDVRHGKLAMSYIYIYQVRMVVARRRACVV